jgi:hypothetical protein
MAVLRAKYRTVMRPEAGKQRVAIPVREPCAGVRRSGLRFRQRSTITRNSSHQCRAGPSQDQRAISMSPVPPSNAVLPVGPAGAAHDRHVGASIVQWSGRARFAGTGRIMDCSRYEDIRPSPRIATSSSSISTGISSCRMLMSVLFRRAVRVERRAASMRRFGEAPSERIARAIGDGCPLTSDRRRDPGVIERSACESEALI